MIGPAHHVFKFSIWLLPHVVSTVPITNEARENCFGDTWLVCKSKKSNAIVVSPALFSTFSFYFGAINSEIALINFLFKELVVSFC